LIYQTTIKHNKMNTAETILNQIGGKKFIAMTGSKDFMNTGNGLQMKLARNNSGAGYLEIQHTESDLYNMVFYSVRGIELKVKKEITNVYADMLLNMFESTTGLIVRF
jgi:hypothetical protein